MNPVDELENQIFTFPQRPLVDVNVIEQGGSPWREFKRDPKVLRADVANIVEHAFDCGGFVAGGCARWLLGIGKVTPLKRGTYVHEGGDIDLWFPSMDSWRQFVKSFTTNEKWPQISLSKGKLAANVSFPPNQRNTVSAFAEPPLVQAICCVTGTPDTVVRSFDFLNSMVAFDRDKTWVVDGWDELEKEKELNIAWWGSRGIASRVSKYMRKYGYRKLTNVSNAMFEQLVNGTNSMTDVEKRRSRTKWLDIFHNDVCDLQTKLLILASTADGIETDDIFRIAKNKFEYLWVGSYENAIKSLMQRQTRANDSRIEGCDDPVGFDAEEYCWAV